MLSLSPQLCELLVAKLLAHENAVVAGLGAASRLDITDRGVDALILYHRLMRLEPNFAIAAPQCFSLRECEQPAAEP